MKTNKNRILAFHSALILLATCLPASAATIVWSFNSDSAAVTTNGLSGDGVTADNVGITDTSSFVTASIEGDAISGASTGGRAQRDLGTFNSVAGDTISFTFTINIGATAVDLTDLSFLTGIDVNAGSANTNHTKWDLSITKGSATTSSFVDSFPGGNGTFTTASKSTTLSGLTNLQNESVTFTFTGDYGVNPDFSGGSNTSRWSFIDDVTFTAAPVPEPSALALVLLGTGVLFLLRRRQG